MAWAQPGFDDSGWGTMDLTPPKGSYDPIIGNSGFVPGWTARGYKGYSGYAWYRLRVNVQNGQNALALKMPDDFDDAYQVYVNGQRIGEFGRFTAHGVTAYFSEPQAFPLPADFRGGPATIAIRMWMAADMPLVFVDVGGLHGPPVLGQQAAIASLLRIDWDSSDRSYATQFVEMGILLLALLVAFALFRLDRSEPAYRWLCLVCTTMLALSALYASAHYDAWIGNNPQFLIQDAVLVPLTIGLWVIFWAYWFRVAQMGQIHRMVWSLVVLLGIGTAMLRAPLYGTVVPVHASAWLTPLTEMLKLLLGLVLVWVTVRGIRKDRFEGWLALPAVVLVAISVYQVELLALGVPVVYFPFGFGIELDQIAAMLSLLIITVLLVRRFLRGQREREQFRQEMEQARQLQQVLIPEALPVVPGFTFESEYRPAQQVGGDFFQIIADPTDGSVLIVLGDVTGHGLQAAMLVSLIVGAIRAEAAHGHDPLTTLNALNQRLYGRGEAHATCLALRIEGNGSAALANAGHLPPYLNGKELPMEGSLPLGMIENAEFPLMNFHLGENDSLILMSDGVVEAQDEHGHLFGFERVDELLKRQITAAEIAAEAQRFGQEDDILVLRVVRTARAVATPSQEPVLAMG